jgi:GNAT superfamily N-acetyltransferase
LWEYNELTTADAPLPADLRQLTVLLRDAEGKVVGGLRGETNWGWLFVRKMAIRKEARHQGWGRQLLALSEQEARGRGCHHAYVDTLSFQALPFYQKQGYTVFGTLDQYPGENKQYFLQKEL